MYDAETQWKRFKHWFVYEATQVQQYVIVGAVIMAVGTGIYHLLN